jgi:hypothetical protein
MRAINATPITAHYCLFSRVFYSSDYRVLNNYTGLKLANVNYVEFLTYHPFYE